jgi:hypothetical protein
MKPPERFYCVVCTDVLHVPVMLKHCGHHFCRECILTALSARSTCPVCRSSHTTIDVVSALFVRESLEDLEVACPNGVVAVMQQQQGSGVLGSEFRHQSEGGCRAVMKLKHLAAHQSSCGGSKRVAELERQLAKSAANVKLLQDELKQKNHMLVDLEAAIEEQAGLRQHLEISHRRLQGRLIDSESRLSQTSSAPAWRKCRSSELELLARMIFPLTVREVEPMVRNGIFDNITALHKELQAFANPDLSFWDLFVVAALAARMPSMTDTQTDRLLLIVQDVLQQDLLPEVRGS